MMGLYFPSMEKSTISGCREEKCDYEIYRDASDVFIPGFNA